MSQIEITLDQLQKFLGRQNNIRYKALIDSAHELERTLDEQVFTNHDDTVHIPSKDALRSNIRSGANHNPPKTPIKGKPYSEEYLEKKRTTSGYFSPHVYKEFAFKHGIKINVNVDNLVMGVKMPETSDKNPSGNFSDGSQTYLEFHEKQRSVLKLAFLRGWGNIIKAIKERYKKEAKR